jgi:methylmalonyl-CoA mutase
VTPLVRMRLAEPFEALRAASRHDRVALVAVGEPAQWRARVEFCRAYFGVGGFEVVETPGTQELAQAVQQFTETGARAAVICSADAVYPTIVPELVPLLREAGAAAVLVAGRPKDQVEALTAAGVDLFVQLGGDAPSLLGSLAQRLEVRS